MEAAPEQADVEGSSGGAGHRASGVMQLMPQQMYQATLQVGFPRSAGASQALQH